MRRKHRTANFAIFSRQADRAQQLAPAAQEKRDDNTAAHRIEEWINDLSSMNDISSANVALSSIDYYCPRRDDIATSSSVAQLEPRTSQDDTPKVELRRAVAMSHSSQVDQQTADENTLVVSDTAVLEKTVASCDASLQQQASRASDVIEVDVRSACALLSSARDDLASVQCLPGSANCPRTYTPLSNLRVPITDDTCGTWPPDAHKKTPRATFFFYFFF